ncbi:hypothetical protein [Leuconostoc citreum]|uniref:hypothetical protein n=1 Tax=Leuconostoc citreum TaxID=33964 RepID=UPI0021A4D090|nr:hypothetical protein [Leuconostoc citreum]MCT3071632.1 hypothetical protein [Leuconostoc citreum]
MKNVYFIKNPDFPNITELRARLSKYNFQVVNASAKKIDFMVVDDFEYSQQIQKRISKLESEHHLIKITTKEFLKKFGFDPEERFLRWQQYPNFNPWTGEQVRIWNDRLVNLNFQQI